MKNRIQRRRVKGWRMPAGAVYVGRGSRWGNPFIVGIHGSVGECVAKFQQELCNINSRLSFAVEDVAELRGKTLVCWCKESDPCHADVLTALAEIIDKERK